VFPNRGIAILANYLGDKAISLSNHGFYKTGRIRVIAQNSADFSNGGVNAVVDIEKDILTPKLVGDLLARYQLAAPLGQQDKQLHGELFQAQQAFTPSQPITGLVKCEIAEMEYLRNESLEALLWVDAIMPDAPPKSN
jgi:hypothetical protein